MKGNVTGMMIGICIFIFCFFLTQALPIYLPELPLTAKSLLFILLTMLGVTAIVAGIMYKK